MDWTQALNIIGGNVELMRDKSLKDYTNEQLMNMLDQNEKIRLVDLAGICSEILRRMNEISPLLKDK